MRQTCMRGWRKMKECQHEGHLFRGEQLTANRVVGGV